MTPVSAATVARQFIEALLVPLAEQPCSCEGETICAACAAVEALERLAELEFIAGLRGVAKIETEASCDS